MSGLFVPISGVSADLQDSIRSGLHLYASHSTLPIPNLTSSELKKIQSGTSVVKITSTVRDKEVSDMGIFGAQLVEAPRLLVWLTLLGETGEAQSKLTRLTLEDLGAGRFLRYQHLDLPWPFGDRHWVIRCSKNPWLTEHSDGAIWQHEWSLVEFTDPVGAIRATGASEVMDHQFIDKAIYLPRNEGAWAVIELSPQQTLVVAYLDAEFGGRLPRRLVKRFSKRRLRADFRRLNDRDALETRDYGSFLPVYDGRGLPIALADVRDTVRSWQGETRLAKKR